MGKTGKIDRHTVFSILLLIIFFTAGFLIACFVLQSNEWTYPPSEIKTDTIETKTLLDRSYFAAVFDALSSAQETIDIAMFEFKFYENENNKVRQLAEALINASAKGIKVRILLDSSDWNNKNTKQNQEMVNYLKENGVDAKLDSPKKTLHTKLIIIDNSILIIGSTNWGFHALERNNEASILIKNKEIASQYLGYFNFLWDY